MLEGVSAGSYVDIQPSFVALDVLAEQFRDDPDINAWLDEHVAQIETSRILRDDHVHYRLPSLGVTAAVARHMPDRPIVAELVSYTAREEGQPWHYFHHWAELRAAVIGEPQEFIDFAVELADIVLRNDLFPEYLYRPLVARLRRGDELPRAIGPLVPAAGEPAAGLVTRLLAITRGLDADLARHVRSRIASLADTKALATIDALSGQIRHEAMLMLDVLDTIS